MPVKYQFKKGEKTVSLEQIDREICEFTGEEINDKSYSTSYMFVTITGVSLLSRNDEITEEDIDRFCDEFHEGKYKELLKEFLVRRYVFDAWRQIQT